MAEKFVAEEGLLKGLVLSFENGEEWTIGRDPEASTLVVEDPAASRKHLLCKRSDEGIVVENLSDTNPSLVNGDEISSPTLLKNGDTVTLGNELFRYYSATEAEIEEPEQEETAEEDKTPPQEEIKEEPPQEEIKEEPPKEEIKEEPPKEEVKEATNKPSQEDEEPKHDSIFDEVEEEDQEILADIDFDLMEQGRFLLKVVNGPNNGAEFSMQPDKDYIIGTDPKNCDIIFHDNSVSRRHVKVVIAKDGSLALEDLGGKNATFIESKKLDGKQPIEPSTIITTGTTSFVIYDREGDMHTIISPLLPSIVKTLQKEEEDKEAKEKAKQKQKEADAAAPAKESAPSALGAFILIAILTGLFVVVGIGTTTLFRGQPIVEKQTENIDQILNTALAPFSDVRRSFNKRTGRLLLVGHVMTSTDKQQLLYNLQGLDFIDSIDDSGIIVDEYAWKEMNRVLARKKEWKGIYVHSTEPGKFVISGHLKTRKEAEKLSEYITSHFSYPNLLEKRILVEENVISSTETALQNLGIRTVTVEMQNGLLTLTGSVGKTKITQVQDLINRMKNIRGVRGVKNYITEVAPEASFVNISDSYEVTGFSSQGKNIHVVVNGRIVSEGDTLNGMTITKITPNAIHLIRDNVRYRIDYNR